MDPAFLRSNRTTSRSRALACGVVGALVLVMTGCGRREVRDETQPGSEPPGSTSAPAQPSPADVSPPLPPGPQIGKRDPLMNSVAPRLADWVAMWRAALPGFAVDSLWGINRGRWRPVYTRKLERSPDPGSADAVLAFKLLGLSSPDGRYVLYVDSYLDVTPRGDSLDIGGEPDSQPVLIDRRERLEAILAQCGTPCGFHWGTWLSPASFALAGWHDADDRSQWKQGHLSIYTVADSSVATYVTRIVRAEDFGRYLNAWRSWLVKRYRSLAARSRS